MKSKEQTMKSKAAIASELNCQPWLISPIIHREFTAGLLAGLARVSFDVEPPPPPYTATPDGLAVIPIRGVLWRGWSDMLYDPWFGITSTDVLQNAVEKAADDPAVRVIMLDVDSPGGVVAGVPEAAKAIKAATDKKLVFSYNSGLMDSAAYWLGSQADRIYSTPSARTGSVGAYIALLDMSRMFDKDGLEMQLFKSGENKGMGMPGTSLTDAQKKRIQARVDKIGAQFRATVSARRPYVSAAMMDGDDYDAEEAAAGMLIDAISTPAEAQAALLDLANQHAAKIEG